MPSGKNLKNVKSKSGEKLPKSSALTTAWLFTKKKGKMAQTTPRDELNFNTNEEVAEIKSTDEEMPSEDKVEISENIQEKSETTVKNDLPLPATPPLQTNGNEDKPDIENEQSDEKPLTVESDDAFKPNCKAKKSQITDEKPLKVESDDALTARKQNCKVKKSQITDEKPPKVESDDEFIELRPNCRVKKSQITADDIESLIVKCTACRKQINHHDPNRVKRHPHLKVLICKDCADFYSSGEFSQDEDGDKYCRWCAQGGTLFGCDLCSNAFCNDCVRLNFGRGEARNISTSSEKWNCYMCNPKQLEEKINFCNLLYEYSKGTSPLFKKKTNRKSTFSLIDHSDLDVTDPQSWFPAVVENSMNVMGKYKFRMEKLKKKANTKSKSTKYLLRKMEEITVEMRSSAKKNYKCAHKLYEAYLSQKCGLKSSGEDNSEERSPKSKSDEKALGVPNGIEVIDDSVEKKDSDVGLNNVDANASIEHISLDDSPSQITPDKSEVKNNISKMSDSDIEEQEVICLDSSDSSTHSKQVLPKKIGIDDKSVKDSDPKAALESSEPQESKPKNKLNSSSESESKKGKVDLKNNKDDVKQDKGKLKVKGNPLTPKKLPDGDSSDSTSTFDSSMDETLRKKERKRRKMKKGKRKKSAVSDSSSPDVSMDGKPPMKISAVKKNSIFTEQEIAEWNINKQNVLDNDIKLKLNAVVELVNDLKIPKEQCDIILAYYSTRKKSKNDIASMEKSVNKMLTESVKRKKGATSSDTDSKVPKKNIAGPKNSKKRKLLDSSDDSDSLLSESSDPSFTVEKKDKEGLSKSRIGSGDSDSSGKDVEAIAENSKTQKKSQKKKNPKKSSSESSDSAASNDSAPSVIISDDDDDFVITKKNRKDEKLLRKANDALKDKEKKSTNKEKSKGKKKQKKRKVIYSDDSDQSDSSSKSSESSSEISDDDFQTRKGKRKRPAQKRKRVKMDNSSDEDKSDDDSDDQKDSQSTPGKGRKNIRNIISDEKLRKDTREAQLIEKERRKRVQERQKLYNCIVENKGTGKETVTKKMVLEVDPESKEEKVEIHPDIVESLKPHQIDGVKFMWESTIESLKELKSKPGSGCILAHCMGLGKTLQVIAFLYSIMTNKYIKKRIHTALIICPNNTVLNWASEFEMWIGDGTEQLPVFEMVKVKEYSSRLEMLKNWAEDGGVLIIGYECFARLVDGKIPKKTKQFKAKVHELIADPGPDIVICDEGHKLKNERSQLARSANQLKTARRIILTGTPLQNNLKEYYVMMNFVKPSLLGTSREFMNRFVSPITNGQYDDSSKHDVKLMKKRVHILHKLLEGCVQRCDYSALQKFLPPKHEFVISVRLSETQIKLYRTYLERNNRNSYKEDGELKVDGRQIFQDFMNLRGIWTFPYSLQLSFNKRERERILKDDGADEDGNLKDFINDDSTSDSSSGDDTKEVKCLDDDLNEPGPSRRTRGQKNCESSGDEVIKSYPRGNASENEDCDLDDIHMEKQWFNEFFDHSDRLNPELGGKIILTLEILKACESIGDKILIFSQSLVTLDIIEMFLKDIHEKTMKADYPLNDTSDLFQTWVHGIDYFRMEGKTHVEQRQHFMKMFNKKENTRARLFLISTKAGSLGTNLVGANRVILFDASWNPSDDVQSIFRVYRFGQDKPVYIYRFLAQGTMEEKIYNRQVTKLSLSFRVVDEQNIDRHFNQSQLAELYTFEPDVGTERPTLMVPKDRLLADIIMSHRDWIVNFFEHDSLLQNTQEDDLTEEERQNAWQEYENEKEGLFQQFQQDPNLQANANINMNANANTNTNNTYTSASAFNIHRAIIKICDDIKKRNPNCSMYEFQAQLFSQVNLLKSKCQTNHVNLLRQKQEFVSKGLQVPLHVNTNLECIQLMMSQIDGSLTKIREDLRKELIKVQQRSNMTQQQPTFPRGAQPGVNPGFTGFQMRNPKTGQLFSAFPSQMFRNATPNQFQTAQQPSTQNSSSSRSNTIEVTEVDASDNQHAESSENSSSPIVTFSEEPAETNDDSSSKKPSGSETFKITEVE